MNVQQRIIEIFTEVKPDFDWHDSKFYDTPLTGDVLRFEAHDIVFLMLEVKEAFNIKLNANDVINYKFNSVNDVIKTVESKCVGQR